MARWLPGVAVARRGLFGCSAAQLPGALLSLKGTRGGRISGWKYRELRVIDGRVWRYDTGFGNRDDEAAATFAISRLLSHHLPREIPNEEQDIVRLIRHQLIRMWDWVARTWHEFALLIRVGIVLDLEGAPTEIKI